MVVKILAIGGMIIESIGFLILALQVWRSHQENSATMNQLAYCINRDETTGKVIGIKADSLIGWENPDNPKDGFLSFSGKFFEVSANAAIELHEKARGLRRQLIWGSSLTIGGLILQAISAAIQQQ